jgi:hypothetical protein
MEQRPGDLMQYLPRDRSGVAVDEDRKSAAIRGRMPGSGPPQHSPLEWASLAILVAAFTVLMTYGLHPRRADEGIYYYDAWRVTRGVVPYRDFFSPIRRYTSSRSS